MTLSASSTLSDKIKRWRNVGKSRGESGQDQSDEVDELGKVWWYESVSVLSVCAPCISCGSFLGYTSSAVPSMIKDVATFGVLNSHQIALIGGLGPLGAILGSIISAIPLKYVGPRRTIALLGISMLILSWVTIGMSHGIVLVYVGRFLGGVGVGATISSAPLYVMDISCIQRRGRLGIMPQFLMISGILISYILGAFLNWSNLSLVACTFLILAAILIAFAPDSPKWLITNGKCEQGFKVLEKIHGTVAAKVIALNMENTSQTISSNPQGEEIWKSKATYKSILVCLVVISIQQLTGVNGITFFATSIFDRSSSSTTSSGHLSSIILATTQLIASFMSTFFVERFGRTFLLKISSATLTLSSLTLGTYFYLLVDNTDFLWLPLTALVIFAFGFAIGLGPVTWIIVAEILPQQVRNLINPLIIGYNWFCVFLVTTSFPYLKEEIYYFGVFWLYAAVAGLGFIFICIFVPETKGQTSEQIQLGFSGKQKMQNAFRLFRYRSSVI
ncbi:facilitated trehalose transporter Tret1 [Folsomia candida]|uniref:facilitated trehalose transporter Tret1 n=1 Tax=Folsomia candida TaxID=158441 RepID=UPI000B8FC6F4|nr:facilitated trehalose transporter Tret1 [Folsomia candida]